MIKTWIPKNYILYFFLTFQYKVKNLTSIQKKKSSQLSFEVGILHLYSSKNEDFRIFDWTFFAWTLTTSTTSRDRNFNLSKLNRVSNFSWRYQLLYQILFVGPEWIFGGFRLRFPKCVVWTNISYAYWQRKNHVRGNTWLFSLRSLWLILGIFVFEANLNFR